MAPSHDNRPLTGASTVVCVVVIIVAGIIKQDAGTTAMLIGTMFGGWLLGWSWRKNG